MPRLPPSRHALCGLALGLALVAGSGQAQVGGSLRIESDYRWRGESLSGTRPALHLDLAWDGAAGAFAGLTAGTVRLDPEQRGGLLSLHAGYAQRGREGCPGWEYGALLTRFSSEPRAGYGELFTGLLGERWSARLYASPDYFGRGTPATYAELDGAWPLTPGWRAQWHAGALTWLGGAPAGLPRARADLRLGLVWTLPRDVALQAAWTTRSGRSLYPYAAAQEPSRSAWVLGLELPF